MQHCAHSAEHCKPRAFTLVELLVVIGIIAMLISVLLPALSAAQRQARTVKCASNMRTLGQLLYMYANDNRGLLPAGSTDVGPSPNSNGNNFTWDDGLNRYVGRNQPWTELTNQWNPVANPIFECPDDRYDRSILYSPYKTRSYSMVEASKGYNLPVLGMATRNFQFTTGWPLNTYFRHFHISEAPNASETLLLAEKPMLANTYVNILGHAGGSIVDCPDNQMLGLSAPLHKGRWNYLMVDGHVELLRPEQTIRAPNTTATLPPNYMWTRTPND